MDSNSNNNGNSTGARIAISMDCEKNSNGCCPVSVSASTTEEKVIPTRFAKRHGGTFFALLNNLALSMEMLMVTLLQRYGIVGQNAAVYGYGGVFLVSLPIFFYYEWKNCWRISEDGDGGGKSCFAGVWPLTEKEKRMNFYSVIGRSLLAPSSTILRYVALEYLTIGDTIVVSYSSPILVAILAHFLLKEKTGFVPILTAFLALLGVGVILRPPVLTGAQSFDHRTVVGLFFAVLAMVCGACTVIVTRKIRKVQFSIVMMFDGLLGMTLAFFTLIPTWAFQNNSGSGSGHGFVFPHGPAATLLVVALALFSSSSVLCHVLSLKFETAEIVALIGTSSSVFAFLVQYAALGIIPDIYSVSGGSLIFLGIMIVSFRKYLMTLPAENGMRKFFFVLLF